MERPHHHHMAAIRELDLSACHPHSIVDRISAVPGLRTSAAFLTFLHANLVIPPSALSSHASTPTFEPSTSFSSVPHPSSSAGLSAHNNHHSRMPPSSPLAAPPLVPLDDIPDLFLDTLDSDEEKDEGLHLISDAVAQMRQKAARAVLFHPLPLAGLASSLYLLYRLTSHDPSRLLFASSVLIISYLLAVRYLTQRYDHLATSIARSWLRPLPDSNFSEEDIVLGARYDGDTLVGALVLHLKPAVQVAGGHRRKGSRTQHLTLRGGTGVVRAWTTKLTHRGQGIGKELLAEAVRITKERCGKDAEVGFAKEHANSTMVLPNIFNGTFRRDEIRAAKALDAAVSEWEATKKRR
ncbi:hypothetical protein NLU13_0687 [Sarocladium strictum]|uniref:N-acetyltransferase domain-containing protein n=1 Tax=Sarocladium strictum TaxID=5046 RepID=A0AA39LB12_SARSR|nr:hypothetical protein NLU13_0687 [Sarocladium strictum]